MSQRHKRDIHGYDVNGDTPYTLGDKAIPAGDLTEDLAGQTVNFLTYFPTATGFSISGGPTGMTVHATTGVLSGTPTTIESGVATLTVTYASPAGTRTGRASWPFAVTAA